MNSCFANSIFTNFASSRIHALTKAARAALDKFAAAARLFVIDTVPHPISRDLKFSHAAYLATSRPTSRDDLHHLRHIGLLSRRIHDAVMRLNLIARFAVHIHGFAASCMAAANTERKRPAAALKF